MARCDPLRSTEALTRHYRSGEAESEETQRKFRVLPNGPGIELPAALNVPRPNGRLPVSRPGSPIPPRPAAGRWEPRQAEMSAGQLQCLVRRRTPDPAVTRRASP
jgi:hypothetical protein